MLKKLLLSLFVISAITTSLTAQCPGSITVTDTSHYTFYVPTPPTYWIIRVSYYTYQVSPTSAVQNDTLVLTNGSRYDTVVTDSVFYSVTSINPDNWKAVELIQNGQVYSCMVPLPVELVFFRATRENNQMKLEWRTASETNNSHFLVQRLSEEKKWVEIARKRGHGTSTAPHHYTHTLDQYEGVQYFILRQVDYDGTEHPSRIIAVNFDSEGSESQGLNLWIGNTKVQIRGNDKIIQLK